MTGKALILVTGGAGYVGSHTIVELLNNDYDVVAIDNLVNSYAEYNRKPESLQRVEEITGKSVTFYNVDIQDQIGLQTLFDAVSFYVCTYLILSDLFFSINSIALCISLR